MKKILALALLVPAMALAQTFPSPTFSSVTIQNPLGASSGGTGVANSSTITLGGNLTTAGANPLTFTTTGSTSITLPTSGTLLNGTSGATSGANSNITSLTGLTTPLSVSQGGTGVTSSTGSGSTVRNTSPAISAPAITNGMSALGSILVGGTAPQATCDPTGSTDATTCLNAAITAAEAVSGGGLLVIPPGTYKVSGTITESAPMTLFAYGATFEWEGAEPGTCCTPVMKIGNPAATTLSQASGINAFGLTVNANNVGNLYGIDWDTVNRSSFSDLQVNNIAAGSGSISTAPFAYYVTSNNAAILNTDLNVFTNLIGNNDFQGLALTGSTTYTSGTTVNMFNGIHLFNLGAYGVGFVGIDLVQNCDSNFFNEVFIATTQGGGTFSGVRFNDGANNTTQDNDVHEEQFQGLTFSGGPTGTTNYGMTFNYAYNIQVYGYRDSAGGGTFTPIAVAGPASVVSYRVDDLTAPMVTNLVTPPVTAVAAAGAGTSPPAPVVQSGSSQISGTITFGSGTSTTVGAQVTVTYPTALLKAPKAVLITPNNGATWSLEGVTNGVTANGFTIFTTNAPTASEPNTYYSVNYLVIP